MHRRRPKGGAFLRFGAFLLLFEEFPGPVQRASGQGASAREQLDPKPSSSAPFKKMHRQRSHGRRHIGNQPVRRMPIGIK